MQNLIEKMKQELKNAEEKAKHTLKLDLAEQQRLLGVVETLRNTIHWAELEKIKNEIGQEDAITQGLPY